MTNAEILAKLDYGAKEVLARMQAQGYECYLVGGSLRDLLLNKPVHDFDFTTNAKPEEVKIVFANERVIETGIKHGTVTVLIAGHAYEITTFRKDTTYSDHRHPDGITFAKTLTEDLARRDFTINALAWSLETGLVDLYDGLGDLEKHLIRAVNEPEERMQEDALRILRALRFASTLEFDIEVKTKRAILYLMPTLSYVARERILEELDKLFTGKAALRILNEFSSLFLAAYPDLWNNVEFNLTASSALWEQITGNKEVFHSAFANLLKLRSAQGYPLLQNFLTGHELAKPEMQWKAIYIAFCWMACLEPNIALIKEKFKLENAKQLGKRLQQSFLWANQRRDLVSLCLDTLSPKNWQSYLLEASQEQSFAHLICTYSCENVALSLLYLLATDRLDSLIGCKFLAFINRHKCFSLRDLQLRGDELLKVRPEISKQAISKNLQKLWQAVLLEKVNNDKQSLTEYAVNMELEI